MLRGPGSLLLTPSSPSAISHRRRKADTGLHVLLWLPSTLLFMGIKIVTPERQKREMERGRNWECSWINALCYDRQQRPSRARWGHGWAVSDPLVPLQSSKHWPSIAPSQPCSFTNERCLARRREAGRFQPCTEVKPRAWCEPGCRWAGRTGPCHQSPIRVLSPGGCFPGSWMMLGVVDPTLWGAWSKLLFDNSGDTMTNPRDAELPTPSARSLREEVLFRQADVGAAEPAQAGGSADPPLPPHRPAASSPLRQRRDPEVTQGGCGGAWMATQSAAGALCSEHEAGQLAPASGPKCLWEPWPWMLLQHSCSGDPDLLPSERSRCWCAGPCPGGLKSLPVPPFLPPRCTCAGWAGFCAAPGTKSLSKVGDPHLEAAGSWCFPIIWPCRVPLPQPPSLTSLPCMGAQPRSPPGSAPCPSPQPMPSKL